MKRLSPLAVGVALSLGTLATTSVAEANVEIGGMAGVHVFNKNNELGVNDQQFSGDPRASERNSILFGLRVGVFFTDIIGVEGEFGVIPTAARDYDYSITNLTYRAHLVAQFLASNPENKIIPFVFAGAGAFSVVSSSNMNFKGDVRRSITDDTDSAFYFGAGVKFRAGSNWGLRADARLLIVPSTKNDTPPSKDVSKVATDFEALASFYFDFGHGTTVVVKEEPPKDDDPDHDGIRGAADQCPTDPEDKDAYQDDDGCPEPDNDGDGILDVKDKCPDKPETINGVDDWDGCPDKGGQRLAGMDGNRMLMAEKVTFDGARVRGKSANLVDQIALTMLTSHGVKKWRIVVAAEKQGSDDKTRALSQQRADVIKAWVVSKGVPADSVEALGVVGDTPTVAVVALEREEAPDPAPDGN